MNPASLSLAVDMYGCPNRCRHCWLGHMPNRRMEEDADRFIMDYFDPYFEKIAYYSWVREPDFCSHYRERWYADAAISKNTAPLRFELASFYRIVRDREYIPFLKEVGTEKVQLTFFGLKETQDRYIGRAGAYEELLLANDMLIENGITPRWQCFINEENIGEILAVQAMAEKLRAEKCPGLEFFVHEGSCDGENEKLYPIRIRREHIPQALSPVYLNYDHLMTEGECCALLKEDLSSPCFPLGEELVLYVSNTFDLFFNYTHMTAPWVIGNIKTTPAEEIMRRIREGDTHALRMARQTTWSALAGQFGDPASHRVFSPDDFRSFLLNRYLAQNAI